MDKQLLVSYTIFETKFKKNNSSLKRKWFKI